MKLLTKNTDYAIRALLQLAQDPEDFISSRVISKKAHIPLPYLRRILNRLREEKIVIAKEGVDGGMKINRAPDKIRITSLIMIFQGEVSLLDCVFRKNICVNVKTCPLRRRIKKIENKVINELDGLTIGDLLDDINKGVER